MTRPLHETLRAIGQGILGGILVAIPLGLAATYLGPGAFVIAVLLTGAGLITIANALKRRGQRKAKFGGTNGQG